MKKIYKKLTRDQKERGVYFSSTLSIDKTERPGDVTHEILMDAVDKELKAERLLDDEFFDASPWKFNIIRRG